jgi:NAD+ kinase
MRIAVFGKAFTIEARPYIEALYRRLKSEGMELALYSRLNSFLRENCSWDESVYIFNNHQELIDFEPDFLFTIGGDGTILDAATLVGHADVPVLGINTGRLGFLANVAKEEINQTVDDLLNSNYRIVERDMLMMATSNDFSPEPNFALNEVTVSRKGTTSMITIHVHINGEFLNSYWADGLIIATPTGSTGYSLSCGGPIIMPEAKNFVITPIAPHNLNVRPFVIPNHYKIKLKVEGRENEYLASLDSRIFTFNNDVEIFLQHSDVSIKLIQTNKQDFPTTLRNKLLWGLDRRN